MQVYRIFRQINHSNSDSFLDLNFGITRKHHIYKLHKPRCNSTTEDSCFSYRIINDCNGLENYVGKVNATNAFTSL